MALASADAPSLGDSNASGGADSAGDSDAFGDPGSCGDADDCDASGDAGASLDGAAEAASLAVVSVLWFDFAQPANVTTTASRTAAGDRRFIAAYTTD